MKKLIAFSATWFLFYLGEFIWWAFKSFLYSKPLIWSCQIQEWAGLEKPWTKPEGGTTI